MTDTIQFYKYITDSGMQLGCHSISIRRDSFIILENSVEPTTTFIDTIVCKREKSSKAIFYKDGIYHFLYTVDRPAIGANKPYKRIFDTRINIKKESDRVYYITNEKSRIKTLQFKLNTRDTIGIYDWNSHKGRKKIDYRLPTDFKRVFIKDTIIVLNTTNIPCYVFYEIHNHIGHNGDEYLVGQIYVEKYSFVIIGSKYDVFDRNKRLIQSVIELATF